MKIVGVTSCIAGLAHTPMAAKALEKAGVKLGYDVKIEQQGALGKVNEITPLEASEADFIIIAADKAIEDMERFEGKRIVRVKIGQAVSKAELVLQKAVEAVQKANA